MEGELFASIGEGSTKTLRTRWALHLQIRSGDMILELMITEGNKQKRQSLNDPAFRRPSYIEIYFLKNFFLP